MMRVTGPVTKKVKVNEDIQAVKVLGVTEPAASAKLGA